MLSVNSSSLRDKLPIADDVLLRTYREDMSKLGTYPAGLEFHDKDPGFLGFVSDSIQRMLATKQCGRKAMEILHCSCGKVESPKEVLEQVLAQNRSDFVRERNGTFYCKLCDSPLSQTTQEAFFHENFRPGDANVLPHALSGRSSSLVAEITSRPVIFSRHARPSGFVVEEKMIDPDFCWMHQIAYLHELTGESEFCLVAGRDSMTEAVKVALFTEMHYPHIKMKIVIHPLLQFPESSPVNKKTTILELVQLCGDSSRAKTLLAASLQWSRHYSMVPTDEIDIIEKSLRNDPVRRDAHGTDCTIEEAIGILKRDSVIKLLKALRQKRELQTNESKLFDALS